MKGSKVQRSRTENGKIRQGTGAAVRSFRLVAEADIRELASSVRLLVHEPTGAQILTLANDDVNKCFGITFRTPLSDSSGVAHILEHSVLCGSRRFPSSAPFAELLRGSLHTHLNASTQPDMTTYIAASQNKRDFHNLLEVYLDAVFHPLLRESTFRQEGWHLVRENGRTARLGGVVYNEMRGLHADPAAVLIKELRAGLFPDTPYRFDHGGDPASIPALTHDELRQFHTRYYQPANALIFLSGDLDMEEQLAFLHERLSAFGMTSIPPVPPFQPPFPASRLVRHGFPGKDSAFVARGWVLPPASDPYEALEQAFLAEALLGSAAAPLRRALMDSEMGEGFIAEGLFQETPQPVLSIGLAGLKMQDAARFDGLIDETLAELARKGFPQELTDACLHRIEFRLRENDGGRYPQGLALMRRVLGPWRWGHDPIDFLAFERPLAKLKEDLGQGGHLLRERLRSLVAENSHRATVLLYPDPEATERALAVERRIVKDLQSKDDGLPMGEEVPATSNLPSLRLDELPREEPHLPCELVREGNPLMLVHRLPTRGIAYFDVGFSLQAVPWDLWPLVPLFGRALLESGTPEENPEQMALRIARFTGGISAEHRVSSRHGSSWVEAWLFLRSRAMQQNFGETLAILAQILIRARFDDRAHFMSLLQDELQRHRSRLVPRGHEYADLALCAALHPPGTAAEAMGGVSQFQYLQRLRGRVETDWESVLADLEALRSLLIQREGAICSLTVEPAGQDMLVATTLAFFDDFPNRKAPRQRNDSPSLSGSSGFPIEAPVNFVGMGLRLPDTDASTGAYAAAVRHIAGTWLWERVRMEGGAYGALARFNPISGNLRFLSYRDPNLLGTLDVFEAVPGFLRRPVSDEEIRRSIIGALGEIDRPKLPGERGFDAMLAMLAGDTHEKRQERRDGLLGATRADFLAFADLIEAREKRVAVLGSRSALEAALRERPGTFTLSETL